MDNLSKENQVLYQNLENWMTNLPVQLKSLPLIHLAIPGSHDSMTSSITYHSKLAPDAEAILQKLKFLGPILRYIMSRWSRTQAFNIEEQLKAGVRYFDLRVATKRGSVYPYFVHGLYAIEVVETLNAVNKFLEAHPNEVVILDFQHFYAFKSIDHANFMRFLTGTFGNKLTPYSHYMEHLTLHYMTIKYRYQVIIIYRSDSAREGQPFLWPSYNFPTPWPETVSIPELMTKLDKGIANRASSRGYVSQCVLTPTNWFVTKHLFSTLKKQCVKPLRKTMLEWLQIQKAGPGGVNIIICDFIDLHDYDFTKGVIALNTNLLQTLQYNASSLTPVDK